MLLGFTMAFATVGAGRASPVLIRFPTTSATEVAFVARGGLWTTPLAGGRAKRISDAPGDVLAPRFSPDGRWIAFTRDLAGDLDLYVAPSAGGEARRLTFDGAGVEGDNLGP